MKDSKEKMFIGLRKFQEICCQNDVFLNNVVNGMPSWQDFFQHFNAIILLSMCTSLPESIMDNTAFLEWIMTLAGA